MPSFRLILASRSPRRIELLNEAGFRFVTEPADIDEEDFPAALSPVALAEYLAHEKARTVAERFPDDIVLGADTVVALGDIQFGKPEDAAHARWMLGQLAGSDHQVITGVCLMHRRNSRIEVRHAVSTVSMRPLQLPEIELYLASGDWRGKAGGYGIQDRDPFVTNMGGSTTNIVGLPMELTCRMLQDWGIACSPS
jgi:septum formation protein